MKTLLIGFITFCICSILAVNIYVCDFMGFCDDLEANQIVDSNELTVIADDTLNSPVGYEQAIAPSDLTIYFSFDKAEFNRDSISEKFVNVATNYLDQDSLAVIRIMGYTDAIGSKNYNKALGFRRAQSMQRYFQSNDLQAERMILESFGENEPADSNNTKEGRANNRRTVITIKN